MDAVTILRARGITIVGSYNVGLFLKGQRLPATGETVVADSFVEGPGGKGSNQAIAAAKFGAPTTFVGRIGADSYGRFALDLYGRLGISTDLIAVDQSTHSGISIILIDSAGRNMISVALGANLHLSPADLDRALPTIRSSFAVGYQLENDLDTVLHGLRITREAGTRTFLDPAPAAPLPDDIYPCIDVIKPNETEASILTGIDVRDVASAAEAGVWFVERGVGAAIVTLGSAGAVLVQEGRSRHYPAPQVRAVDTTGAGDIFSGAFLASLSAGKALGEAIVFANSAAALSTEKIGVVESIPEPDAVARLLQDSGSGGTPTD
jgi:ribokinase